MCCPQENDEEEEEGIGAEEEPLCSDDDVSDEENQNDLFDTDNVVVCQYDKVSLNWIYECECQPSITMSKHPKPLVVLFRLHDHVINGNFIWKMVSWT